MADVLLPASSIYPHVCERDPSLSASASRGSPEIFASSVGASVQGYRALRRTPHGRAAATSRRPPLRRSSSTDEPISDGSTRCPRPLARLVAIEGFGAARRRSRRGGCAHAPVRPDRIRAPPPAATWGRTTKDRPRVSACDDSVSLRGVRTCPQLQCSGLYCTCGSARCARRSVALAALAAH